MVVICEKCGKSFLKPCKLKLHVETVHLKLKKFKCSHCDECLASSVALKYHIVRKHQDHCDYSCEDCDRSFKTQSGLDQHLNVHDKGKTFVCQECNMELKHRTLFKNHMKKHEMMKDTTCKFCHKTYPTHQKMKEHFYNTHRKNPMLRCSFCTKKYFQQVTLDKHLAVHSILICDFCGFKQVNKVLMTKHILIHLREINVNCKVEPKITKKEVKKYQKSISRKEGRLKNSENLLIPPVLDNLKEDPLTNPLEIEQIVIKDEIDDIKNEDNEVADPSDKSDSSNQIVGFAERNSEAKTKIVKRRSKTIPCKAENCESKFCSIKEMHEHTAKIHNLRYHGSYPCPKCDQHFEWQNLFSQHFEETHTAVKDERVPIPIRTVEKQLPQMYCQLCCRMGKSREEMKSHFIDEHKKFTTVDCKLCWFTFVSQQALVDHLGMVHNHKFPDVVKKKANPIKKNLPKVRINCTDCTQTFSSISTLNNHKAVKHSKIPKHPCKICNEYFFTLDQVYNHSKKVHEGGSKLTRKCGVCQLEFTIAQDFYDHIATHTGSLICKLCGENPKDEEAAKKHQISHRKIDDKYKKVVCDVCGKKFVNESMLKVHMFHHSTEKTFMCNFPDCGKSFRFQASYCIHKNSHDKKIECQVCHRMFATKQSLFHHSLSHTGEKPFECKICKKKYASLSMVSYCKKKHDGTLPEIPCEICGKTFNSKFFLKSHMVLQHEKRKDFTCVGCGEAFAFMKQLENHTANKCTANS